MNIATRISILFIVAAALLVAVATGSTAQREYQHVLQQLEQNSQATVLRQCRLFKSAWPMPKKKSPRKTDRKSVV